MPRLYYLEFDRQQSCLVTAFIMIFIEVLTYHGFKCSSFLRMSYRPLMTSTTPARKPPDASPADARHTMFRRDAVRIQAAVRKCRARRHDDMMMPRKRFCLAHNNIWQFTCARSTIALLLPVGKSAKSIAQRDQKRAKHART